ncbi:hypothetical protein FB45DRAFT_930225 [Roridomyces roridus]|uniref:F-box domain-containing protein n=1 Tax=Roridomyces roridus TaxID=1738132 RepID=A0AAD7BGU6_9AGAR|nr:hypothetical protein FB45DRAFT_930225 [Roridomyces roridus]
MNVADVPPEILGAILAFLDPPMMLACSTVSRLWHETITTSPYLQYAIELWSDGLVSGDTSSSQLTTSDKLQTLYERRRSWLNLDWTSRTTIDLPSLHNCRAFELVGGVFALQEWGSDFRSISLLDLDAHPETTVSRKPLDLSGHFEDFAIDPTQDLLITLSWADDVACLTLRTLSQLQAHPMAKDPVIRFKSNEEAFQLTFSIQIAGDVVGLSLIGPDQLRLWNWRTGILFADFPQNDDPEFMDPEFQFLSPRAFVVAERTAQISIFVIEERDGAPTGVICIATLKLPALTDDAWVRSFCAHAGPIRAHPARDRPFYPPETRRIFLFLMSFSDNGRWLRLFVHYRTLYRYVVRYLRGKLDTYVEVPWEEWGPEHTRLLPASDYRWLRHVHGERAIFPTPDGKFIRLLDFGPIIPGRSTDDDGLMCIPTTVDPADSPFKDAVTTSLPYRSLQRTLEEEFDVFLIDQDHIVASRLNTDQMTVFSVYKSE